MRAASSHSAQGEADVLRELGAEFLDHAARLVVKGLLGLGVPLLGGPGGTRGDQIDENAGQHSILGCSSRSSRTIRWAAS